MANIQLLNWLRFNFVGIILCASFLFLNIFSLSTLTTKPALWYDEGMNIELARNFSLTGDLDLVIAPNTLSGQGALIGSTGYPVTVPLSIFFKIFGFGFEQARIYMLIWMNVFLLTIFLFSKNYWGKNIAAIITLLLVTYPPFYGNGRSVMGEIPGFVFLLLSLHLYNKNRNFILAGFLAGLATICKPSVFIFFLPIYAIIFLLDKKEFFKKTAQFGLGSMLSLIPWALIYRDTIFNPSTWTKLLNHFSNPYAEAGITTAQNISANLASFLSTGTILYMLALTGIIILAIYKSQNFYANNRKLLLIAVCYAPLALFFFLKSAGYLRYLIALQFLIIVIAVPAIISLSRRYSILFLSGLILFHAIYLFTGAKLFYSDRAQQTEIYLKANFPEETIGVLNNPVIASVIAPDKKYSWLSTFGLWNFGQNSFELPKENRPGVLVFDRSYNPTGAEIEILEKEYSLNKDIDGDVKIYLKK